MTIFIDPSPGLSSTSADKIVTYQHSDVFFAYNTLAPLHELYRPRPPIYKMHTPLRIAVLECDTPLDSINRQYNGYGGVFRTLLTTSAKALNQPEKLNPETGLEITAWDIVNDVKYPKLEDVDAVLLTGSSAERPNR